MRLNCEDLNRIADVRVYVNDVLESSVYNNGRIYFPSRGISNRRIFLDCYGFAELSITLILVDGQECTLNSEYLPILVRREELNNSVEAMARFVYNNQEWLLLNGELKPKKPSGLKENGYRSLATQILLAEEIAAIYESSYGYFKANSRFKLEKMSVIENEVGKYGILAVKIVHYHSPKDDEDCIIATAVDSEGRVMPDDFVEKLMSISGHVSKDFLPVMDDTHLQTEMALKRKALNESIALRDKQFIDEESAKIEQWAEDQTFSLEEELRDVKKRIKEREREFRKETDDHRRRQLQTEIINLQRNQRQKRQELFSLEDEIIVRRDALIAAIDSSLDKAAEEEHLFTIAWQVV